MEFTHDRRSLELDVITLGVDDAELKVEFAHLFQESGDHRRFPAAGRASDERSLERRQVNRAAVLATADNQTRLGHRNAWRAEIGIERLAR